MVVVAVCEHCGLPMRPEQRNLAGVKLPCARVYHIACLESLSRARARARGLTAAPSEGDHYCTTVLRDPCHPENDVSSVGDYEGHECDDPPPPYTPRPGQSSTSITSALAQAQEDAQPGFLAAVVPPQPLQAQRPESRQSHKNGREVVLFVGGAVAGAAIVSLVTGPLLLCLGVGTATPVLGGTTAIAKIATSIPAARNVVTVAAGLVGTVVSMGNSTSTGSHRRRRSAHNHITSANTADFSNLRGRLTPLV
ncbi:hypothetical protein CERSUDRAFT_119395 [Gelatoporia subvermispora B]|uniref:Uncharacterized protein n=1 Tax=Ceriporiopsis subvermispora (strain B) TaxID=914234 RepID=M2QZ60_CERS8|nr:hypothetical protein CERSUDRAFT_119395 [Gelatoporia subvermispora B]